MKLADAPDVLTVEQAADVLAISPGTLYAAIRAGQFNAALRVGGCIRIPRARLAELLGADAEGKNGGGPAANGADAKSKPTQGGRHEYSRGTGPGRDRASTATRRARVSRVLDP